WQVHPIDSGFIISDFRNGILTARGFSYLIGPLVKEGVWIYYLSDNGSLDRDETFRNNEIVDIRYWDEETDTFITDVFTVTELGAEFEGGDEALHKFLVSEMLYPEEAKEKGEQGRIFVNFIVMEDGSLKRIRIIHGAFPSLSNEALRVVRMSDGKWKPAMHKGVPVKVSYNLPIMFKLN
ncbi:MAG: energy transducer TonB, partial [Bacteroidota bacterium]